MNDINNFEKSTELDFPNPGFLGIEKKEDGSDEQVLENEDNSNLENNTSDGSIENPTSDSDKELIPVSSMNLNTFGLDEEEQGVINLEESFNYPIAGAGSEDPRSRTENEVFGYDLIKEDIQRVVPNDKPHALLEVHLRNGKTIFVPRDQLDKIGYK